MISKLLTLLGAAKGATVAAVVVLSATTATVAVSSPEVRDTVDQVVAAVTGQTAETEEAKADKAEKADSCDTDGKGQPVVVAQRNTADKLLRASFKTHQKALEDLRGKGEDNKAAGPIVKKADDDLKDVMTKALNAIGANTLGRDGQNKDTAVGTTPKPSHSPKPTCAAPVTGAAVSAPEQTTLTAANKTIVDKAIKDMDDIVAKAKAAVAALPTPDHGKPADAGSNGNKPADSNGAKPATVPGGGKPSESPKR